MSGDHADGTLSGVIRGYSHIGIDVTKMGDTEPVLLSGGCEVTIFVLPGELPDWLDVGQRVRIGRRA